MKNLLWVCPWIAASLVAIASVGVRPMVGTALAEPAAAGVEQPAIAQGATTPVAPESDARAQVVRLEAGFLDIMQRAVQLGFEGRLTVITPIVEETIDLEFMARTSIGRAWTDFTPDLKARWVETFSRYTRTKFADQFDRYSGHMFVLDGERPASRNTVMVMTSIQREDKEPVRLDFRLHRTTLGWRIIDVYAKGHVSELALRRSEYGAILERSGVDALFESVDELSTRTARKADAQ